MSTKSQMGEVKLTDRQVQVLEMLSAGLTNPQIAEQLGISLPGAKWHVSEVMNKLGVSTRDEAAQLWRAHRSAGARLSRLTRGFAAAGALKWAALGGGAAAAIGAGAVMAGALVTTPDEPTPPDPVVATVSDSDWTPELASARAKELAVEMMRPFGPYVAPPPGQEWEPLWQLVLDPLRPGRVSGRPVAATDLVVLAIEFLPAQREARTNVTSRPIALALPTDIWVADLAIPHRWDPNPPRAATYRVVFADGTGALLAGGMIADLPIDRPGVPEGVELAAFGEGAARHWFASVPDRYGSDGWSSDGPGRACFATMDSRMPGGSYRTCAAMETAISTDALEVYSLYNAQGNGVAAGVVSPEVVEVRATTEDGRIVTVRPGAAVPGQEARGFLAVAPGSAWFVSIEALDGAGDVIASSDYSDHPG